MYLYLIVNYFHHKTFSIYLLIWKPNEIEKSLYLVFFIMDVISWTIKTVQINVSPAWCKISKRHESNYILDKT